MTTKTKKIAILFERLGPYHHARLKELVKVSQLKAIEFSGRDETYKWDIVKPSGEYPVIQLFCDADIAKKSPALIKSRVNQALEKSDAEIVAIPGWSSTAALATLSWCLKNKIPAILMSASTVYDEPRKRWKEWIKSRIIRLFSAALVGGLRHVDYTSKLGMNTDRIFNSYDVVDNDYFQLHSNQARLKSAALRLTHGLPNQYFLASNRFIQKKNLSRLIDAYAIYMQKAGDKSWGLVMLGDGPLMTEINLKVERLGLSANVHFPGFKQYDELPIYYGLASVFIQASTSEQWGLVVNEAMASGLPVLVSNHCGCAPDLVKSGINGFTFNPYDIDELASHMLNMSNSNFDLSTMGYESQKIVSDYSPRTFAENMIKAATAAIASPTPAIRWYDRVLLWLLIQR